MPVLTRVISTLFRGLAIARPRCALVVDGWIVDPSGEAYQALDVPSGSGLVTHLAGRDLRNPTALA